MTRFNSTNQLAEAVEWLINTEPRFAAVVDQHGLPSRRTEEAGLETLLRIVTDQMISLSAGQAIWTRLARRLTSFDPETVLAYSEAELRSLGLSAAKARTFHAAARAFRDRSFPVGENDLFSDAQIQTGLTAIPGVGPWTANIYLLTAVRSADAWPAADIALQWSAKDLLALPARPSVRDMNEIAEVWRPYRSAAALLLCHYRGLKQMPQV